MRQLPRRAGAPPRGCRPRHDAAQLRRSRPSPRALGRSPARGRRDPRRSSRLAHPAVDRVARDHARHDRRRRHLGRVPPALPAARVPARDAARRARGAGRLSPHPRTRLRRRADRTGPRTPVDSVPGDAGRTARRRRHGIRLPGRRGSGPGRRPRHRPAGRGHRRHRSAHLHLRHHRPSQGRHDYAPGAPHRRGSGERALADGPAAAAPHDAREPHRGRGDGGRLRPLHRRHPGVPGPLRRGRPAAPAGGGAHPARAGPAGAVSHDGESSRFRRQESLPAPVHHLGRGSDGGRSGGGAAIAAGRAAHGLR